jgi:hypothetical protein
MSRSRSTSRSGNVVEAEVANLFKMGSKVNQAALVSLQRKYGDVELLNQIRNVFVQRHAAVVRGAKKFANAVRARYAQTNTPYSLVLQKARAHARKYKLSEAEFAEFQRIYEQELAGGARSAEVVVPLTNMMRVLGHLDAANEGVQVSEADYKHLQELLNLHHESRQLHAQVVLQAIRWNLDCRSACLRQNYERHLHNVNDHIHPVVVAMFLRPNAELDSHFLHSNIAGIVKARYEKEPLITRSDYELFYDMVTDPNDIVCDHRSPLADLLHRANLQVQLWNCVLNLRNGQVYHPSHREFLSSVDVCRLNKYDNPDFLYGRHDGTVLKRLLSAFSYRPTVVSTMPVGGTLVMSNPYYQNVNPTVTKLPMITVKVVRNMYQEAQKTNPNVTSLCDLIRDSQEQFFIEGSVVVKRKVEIVYSRGNVVVYLDRRTSRIDLDQFKPASYKSVPVGVGGFEKILTENAQVLAQPQIQPQPIQDPNAPLTLPDEQCVYKFGKDNTPFHLSSVVLADTEKVDLKAANGQSIQDPNGTEIITGSHALVRCNEPDANGNPWVRYAPMKPCNEVDSFAVVPRPDQDINEKSLVLLYTAVDMEQNLRHSENL